MTDEKIFVSPPGTKGILRVGASDAPYVTDARSEREVPVSGHASLFKEIANGATCFTYMPVSWLIPLPCDLLGQYISEIGSSYGFNKHVLNGVVLDVYGEPSRCLFTANPRAFWFFDRWIKSQVFKVSDSKLRQVPGLSKPPEERMWEVGALNTRFSMVDSYSPFPVTVYAPNCPGYASIVNPVGSSSSPSKVKIVG